MLRLQTGLVSFYVNLNLMKNIVHKANLDSLCKQGHKAKEIIQFQLPQHSPCGRPLRKQRERTKGETPSFLST